MTSRRLSLVAAALGLLAATSAGAQVLIERNPAGDPFFIPPDGPWAAGQLVCTTGENEISVGGACNDLGGGGTIESASGATWDRDHWENDVATVAGQAFVETADDLPAGGIVRRCYAEVTATVTTSTSAGILLGLEGADDLFGDAAGSIGSGTFLDTTWTSEHAIYADTPVRVTVAGGGTYSDNAGEIRVVCFFDRFGDFP